MARLGFHSLMAIAALAGTGLMQSATSAFGGGSRHTNSPRRKHAPEDTTRRAFGITKEHAKWNAAVDARKAAKKNR